MQDSRDGVVQNGGGEGAGCLATKMDVCSRGKESGEVRDSFWRAGARVDGNVRGEGQMAEHGVDDYVVIFFADELG